MSKTIMGLLEGDSGSLLACGLTTDASELAPIEEDRVATDR
jgi:hypothetical protein